MRAYGLIEGRGEVRVSDIGEKIARRRSEMEYKEALIDAIKNIPLWNILYERYTKQGKDLDDKLWLVLETECGLPPKDAREKAPIVSKHYNEDVKAIRSMSITTVNEPIMITEQSQQNSQASIGTTNPKEGLIDYGFGRYKVYLPENEEEAKAVWSKIKKMVDPIFDENA